MKPLKYTVAALALVAMASFTQSAMAQATSTSSIGDLILGVEDSSTGTTTVTNNIEFDLGSYGSLTSGESWNLGSLIETTFSSDSSAVLEYDIVASGGSTGGTGGLGNKIVAFTDTTAPTASLLTTPYSRIANYETAFANKTEAQSGTGYEAVVLSNSTTASFGATGYGQGSGADFGSGQNWNAQYTLPASSVGTALGFYTDSTSGAGTLVGTFQFSVVNGNDILTFDPAAVPEPSTYALGLCAVALFFVLKRRRSVA